MATSILIDLQGAGPSQRDDNQRAAKYALQVGNQLLVHLEIIMYGRYAYAGNCTGNVPSLLPGWAEFGANSVLINGQPINGADPRRLEIPNDGQDGDHPGAPAPCSAGIFNHRDSFCWVNTMAGRALKPGDTVRVTGVLAKDEHSSIDEPGVEIHPVSSIDIIDPSRTFDPTGAWEASDVGTYYMRQLATMSHFELWWLGMSEDRGRTFANVFHGTNSAGFISGSWADIPLGQARGFGYLRLQDLNATNQSRTSLVLVSVSGGFGGKHWDKLYPQ
jgi:hypothetical protein